jgi:hypothetical protein
VKSKLKSLRWEIPDYDAVLACALEQSNRVQSVSGGEVRDVIDKDSCLCDGSYKDEKSL